MKIQLFGGRHAFVIHIPRPDKMIMLFTIPIDVFHNLKSQMEENIEENRTFLFPIGNFEEMAYKPRPVGMQPTYEVQNFVTFTPEGLVLSIVDYEEEKEARSMAIPFEVFDRLENPTLEMDLAW
jgi:hypothetical protein